jgi:hypothetical protein
MKGSRTRLRKVPPEREREEAAVPEAIERLISRGPPAGSGIPFEDQTLGAGNRVECSVLETIDPWHRRPVVEAREELATKNHPPRPADHDSHQVRCVSRRHEIDDRHTTRIGFEFGFEDERAGTVAPARAARRILWGRQLSGWNLPPLVIRAFGAHCHQRT